MTGTQGWRHLTLEEIALGGMFTDGDWVESKDQDPSGGVRLTQLADVGDGLFRDRSNRWLREDQASRLNCTFLMPDDILIARMPDPLGRACLAPANVGRSVTVVDVAVLRITRDDVDARYVMWAINSPEFRHSVEALQSGTTRKRISRRKLASLTLPVPTIDEQLRIVGLLEGHLSRLDAANRELAVALARAAAFERSVIDDFFIHRASSDGWPIFKLEELASDEPRSVTDGPFGSNLTSSHYTESGARVVRLQNIGDGRYRPADAFISLDHYRTLIAHDVRAGDVVIASLGDLLPRAAVVPDLEGPAIVKADCIRVRARDDIDPAWIALACRSSRTKQWAEALVHGVGRQRLGMKGIRDIPVPLPDYKIRVATLDSIGSSLESNARLRLVINVALTRGAVLRRSLLSSAFSGALSRPSIEENRLEEMSNV
jgi:type I restriction enzyme, S subunit